MIVAATIIILNRQGPYFLIRSGRGQRCIDIKRPTEKSTQAFLERKFADCWGAGSTIVKVII